MSYINLFSFSIASNVLGTEMKECESESKHERNLEKSKLIGQKKLTIIDTELIYNPKNVNQLNIEHENVKIKYVIHTYISAAIKIILNDMNFFFYIFKVQRRICDLIQIP